MHGTRLLLTPKLQFIYIDENAHLIPARLGLILNLGWALSLGTIRL